MPVSNRSSRVRIVSVAAAVIAGSMATATAAGGSEPADPIGPVFVDGQAQVVPEFQDTPEHPWVRQEVWVETEFDTDGDGALDRVHVTLARPGPTETHGLRVPVVYQTSPYYAGGPSLEFWDVDHELGAAPTYRGPAPDVTRRETSPIISTALESTWIPRGFAVVHSESPGSGLSQGCPTVGGVNESLAPKAVVDWLNGRASAFTAMTGGDEVVAEWATGSVGMTGTSYNGTLPIAAATTGVDGLDAIIPAAAISEWYQYYRDNGAVRAPGGYQGEDLDVLFDYVHTRDDGEFCNATIREKLTADIDRSSGDYNAMWDERNYLDDVSDIRAATLISHGLSDWNVMPQQAAQLYDALRAQGTPAQVYFHQGGHSNPIPLPLQNLWFSRYLYDVDNGVEDHPRAWIVREGAPASDPTPYDDYPNPAASPVRFLPTVGGTDTGGFTPLTLPDADVETIVDAGDAACGVANLSSSASPHRLVYSTPELSAPLHLSGSPEVTVRLSADVPAVNLTAALVRLPWTGAAECASSTTGSGTPVVTRGWVDPQNTESLYRSDPLTPGEYRDVTFTLQATDKIVPAGTQLGLVLFSTDREFTIRPAPGARLDVDLGGTTVELPVVGGRFALGICPEVDENDTVVIGDIVTTVPNDRLAGTCSVSDHLLVDEDWTDSGSFVRHVGAVGDDLVGAGVLTGRERNALVTAAVRSGIGRG